MSLNYLKEYVDDAILALELAKKEMAHLLYTHQTLYTQPIDSKWVKALTDRQDLAEKVDAFVSRFGRLQDQIGEKLIPRFIALTGGSTKSLLDALAYAEKMGWLDNAEVFISARKLRNLLTIQHLNLDTAVKPRYDKEPSPRDLIAGSRKRLYRSSLTGCLECAEQLPSFLESLQNAKSATHMLTEIVRKIEQYANTLGIS